MSDASNPVAGSGQVYVCGACGKRSRDLFGNQKIDQGWDESCMLNAVLCDEGSLVFENGRVVKADAAKETTP